MAAFLLRAPRKDRINLFDRTVEEAIKKKNQVIRKLFSLDSSNDFYLRRFLTVTDVLSLTIFVRRRFLCFLHDAHASRFRRENETREAKRTCCSRVANESFVGPRDLPQRQTDKFLLDSSFRFNIGSSIRKHVSTGCHYQRSLYVARDSTYRVSWRVDSSVCCARRCIWRSTPPRIMANSYYFPVASSLTPLT